MEKVKIKLSLQTHFMLLLGGAILVSFAVIYVMLASNFRGALKREIQNKAEAILQSYATSIHHNLLMQEDTFTLKQKSLSFFERDDIETLTIKNAKGNILLALDKERYPKEKHLKVHKKLHFDAINKKTLLSEITIGFSLSQMYQSLADLRRKLLYTALILLVLLMVVISLVSKHISSVLTTVMYKLQDLARGKEKSAPITSSIKELNELTTTFNQTVGELKYLREVNARKSKLEATGEIIESVAHEMNNPLGNIQNYCKNLFFELEDAGIKNEYEKPIEFELSRIKSFFDEVLNYTRPLEMNMDKIYVINALEQSIAPYKLATDRKYEVKTIYNDKNAGINVDLIQFTQVIQNILNNAIESFSNGCGEMCIQTSLRNDRVQIDLRDNGAGIPSDKLPLIFKPYFTTKSNGNGKGLYLVQKIIDAHGGDISVVQNMNRGVTMRITLPVVKMEEKTL